MAAKKAKAKAKPRVKKVAQYEVLFASKKNNRSAEIKALLDGGFDTFAILDGGSYIVFRK